MHPNTCTSFENIPKFIDDIVMSISVIDFHGLEDRVIPYDISSAKGNHIVTKGNHIACLHGYNHIVTTLNGKL